MKTKLFLCSIILAGLLSQCKKDEKPGKPLNDPAIVETFGANIDLFNLENYAGQKVPSYILKNNAGTLPISDAKATLGRVLFYDKQLSIDNSISCSSCHLQEFAFGDTTLSSRGVQGGRTSRHAMRLINVRFGNEKRLFWDKRAASLEEQSLMPVKDHSELGYSGLSGRPDMKGLILKLQRLEYYKVLFRFIYNDTSVTEKRMTECLSDFIRSIQSYDSKYDQGRQKVDSDLKDFPNFSQQENHGKSLFMQSVVLSGTRERVGGGLGCDGCHDAPEFDINPAAGNNGITGRLNASGNDYKVTRSPSLRDITNAFGRVNTPMMHTAQHSSLNQVLEHYNEVKPDFNNPEIDPRMFNNGAGQRLKMTNEEKQAVIAFLKTLGGTEVYRNKKWSNPFLKP